MTKTAGRFVQKKAGAQIKKRVSGKLEQKLEQKVQNTKAARVSGAVTARAAVVVDKADEKVAQLRRIKGRFSKALAVIAGVLAIYHRLNKLYSYIPKAKNLNDKVAALTGVDIASKIMPTTSK